MSNEKDIPRIDPSSFPSNSHKSRTEPQIERPKRDKIVTGGVRKQKKTLGKKFAETFVADDSKSVISFIVEDIIIPTGKNTLVEIVKTLGDIVQDSVNMVLFGEKRSTIRRPMGQNNRFSYNSIFTSNQTGPIQHRSMSHHNRARHDFKEILLEHRAEADEVIFSLINLIDDYGQATVADLYDFVGVDSNYVDMDYGWTNLDGVKPIRERGGGYLINLPKPRKLD